MKTKNIIIICVILIIVIIGCYFYFKDFGHKNLFNEYKLFYGNKVVYIGSEDMKESNEGVKYTFSIWIRPNNLSLNTIWENGTNNAKTIINNNGSPNILYLVEDNIVRIQLGYYGKDNYMEYYNFDLENFELQRWTHLAIVVDNKLVSIYKNGIVYASKELENPNMKNYKLMNIGEKYNNFNGYIGRIDYYNYILTPPNINKLYETYFKTHPTALMSYEYNKQMDKENEENLKMEIINNRFA